MQPCSRAACNKCATESYRRQLRRHAVQGQAVHTKLDAAHAVLLQVRHDAGMPHKVVGVCSLPRAAPGMASPLFLLASGSLFAGYLGQDMMIGLGKNI